MLKDVPCGFKFRFYGKKSCNNPTKLILEDLTRTALYLNSIIVELHLKLEADTGFFLWYNIKVHASS